MIEAHEARVQVTWNGQQGDLPHPVHYESADGDVMQWATEAVRGGAIPGIDADPNANFQDFVVDRYNAKDGQPNRISIRPKVPFGEDAPRLPAVRIPRRAVAEAAFFCRYDDAEDA